jgi:small subunit ribosomal protein S17
VLPHPVLAQPSVQQAAVTQLQHSDRERRENKRRNGFTIDREGGGRVFLAHTPCADPADMFQHLQVCSNKMDKSVVVIVEIRHWVNKYRAWKTSLRKYMAHDMENTCNIGDVVKIEQAQQKLSKRKAFNVIEVLQREKIVVQDSAESKGESLHGALTKRPKWAGLSPAVAHEIEKATSSYAGYYNVSDTAHQVARKLPGWRAKVATNQPMGSTSSTKD